jgi:UDP-glucuronate decarboxylase
MNSEEGIIGPINLGNPVEITMLELAENILRLTNSKSKLIFMPLPMDDPRQRQPNINLAIEKLDWKPLISINDGLNRTIEYFRGVL